MAPIHGPAPIHGLALYASQIIIKIGHIICGCYINKMYATNFVNIILLVKKSHFVYIWRDTPKTVLQCETRFSFFAHKIIKKSVIMCKCHFYFVQSTTTTVVIY